MNVAQAKQVHLKDLLNRLGYEPKREDKGEHWYISPFRREADASFKITRDGRGWYDHGAGHGGNILDFIIRYFNLPENGITEALSRLNKIFGTGNQIDMYAPVKLPETVLDSRIEAADEKTDIRVEKIGSVRRRALVQYLAGRGIPLALAHPYLQQMDYFYEERRYFALAFASDSGGYELRNAHFKGCYGPKDISVRQVGTSSAVAVFEGFMDFLSAVAYTRRAPHLHTVVLNSGSMRERAVNAIRSLKVQRVHLYLDQDTTGRELTACFIESLSECEVRDESYLYQGYKDLNEYWKSRKDRGAPQY